MTINCLRLWFSAFACGLLNALRQQALRHTELANAQVGTPGTQLLKLGTLIRVCVRRIHLAFHSPFPRQNPFHCIPQGLTDKLSSGVCLRKWISTFAGTPVAIKIIEADWVA